MENMKLVKNLKYMNNYIDAKIEELYRLNDIATKITTTYNDMPNNEDSQNKKQEIMCKIADLQKEINTEIDKYIKQKDKALKIIGGIDDLKSKSILIDRYVNGMTLEQIGDKYNYSYQGIQKIIKKSEKLL